jgi:hypothetical protein
VSGAVVARICVVLAAAGVLAWLGVMEYDARTLNHGVRTASEMLTSGEATPAGFRSAEADFRDARLLSPDTTPDLHRAVLYRVHGREPQAVALLEDMVRREPDNVTAWNVLYALVRERDRDAARRALAARRRLDPLSVRGR